VFAVGQQVEFDFKNIKNQNILISDTTFRDGQQAFASESIAYCATLAAQQKKMVTPDEVVPADLKHLL
jgi:hypothetical protein